MDEVFRRLLVKTLLDDPRDAKESIRREQFCLGEDHVLYNDRQQSNFSEIIGKNVANLFCYPYLLLRSIRTLLFDLVDKAESSIRNENSATHYKQSALAIILKCIFAVGFIIPEFLSYLIHKISVKIVDFFKTDKIEDVSNKTVPILVSVIPQSQHTEYKEHVLSPTRRDNFTSPTSNSNKNDQPISLCNEQRHISESMSVNPVAKIPAQITEYHAKMELFKIKNELNVLKRDVEISDLLSKPEPDTENDSIPGNPYH
jgi:hypothetical protein